MIRTQNILLTFVVLILGFQARADDAPSFVSNLSQGHWEVGGSLTYQQYSSPTPFFSALVARDYSNYGGSVGLNYLVTDWLSLGAKLAVSVTQGAAAGLFSAYTYTSFQVAPRAHFYFLRTERLALKLGLGYSFDSATFSGYPGVSGGFLFSDFAALYFLTPSIALGPSFEYDFTQGTMYTGSPQFFLSAGFFLYL